MGGRDIYYRSHLVSDSGFSGHEHLRQAEPYEIVEEAFFFVQFLLLLLCAYVGANKETESETVTRICLRLVRYELSPTVTTPIQV